ncbi:hypothetical protein AVEN_261666-1 [Araneus ventricosus]|uniref:Uncharacterized protein n=1 Tax=Araneus ventricosus TaxID=182803 RepID=A0A4Y2DY14_ARAVE|nr:hypothetical protein AVEN_261666-1 [Araneus ventricosus]
MSTGILGRAYQPLPNHDESCYQNDESPHRIIYAMSNDGGRRVSVSFWWSGNFVWTIDPWCVEHQNKISPMGSYIEAVEKSRQSEIIAISELYQTTVCSCAPHVHSTGSIAVMASGMGQRSVYSCEDHSYCLIYQL